MSKIDKARKAAQVANRIYHQATESKGTAGRCVCGAPMPGRHNGLCVKG